MSARQVDIDGGHVPQSALGFFGGSLIVNTNRAEDIATRLEIKRCSGAGSCSVLVLYKYDTPNAVGSWEAVNLAIHVSAH